MRNLVIGLALLVAACGTLPSVRNPITNTNLYQAELVFDGAVKSFVELRDLCARRVIPAACRTYVQKGQDIIRRAQAADQAARAFVLNNPTLDPANAVSAFAGLVTALGGTVGNLGALK